MFINYYCLWKPTWPRYKLFPSCFSIYFWKYSQVAQDVKSFEGTAHIAATNGWSFVRSSCKVQVILFYKKWTETSNHTQPYFKTASKISETVGKFNKIILPLAVAGTVITAGASIYKDYGNGTTRNTVKICAGIAVSLGGGVGGKNCLFF